MTRNEIALEGSTAPDAETLAALTGEGGPLQNGVLPNVDATCADGEKNLWESLGHNPVSKLKRERTTPENAEEMVPKTPKEILP